MSDIRNTELMEEMELFYELLKKEYGIYEKMLMSCRDEHAFIAAGDIEKLRASLQSKDEFLDQIITFEKQLVPLKKQWNTHKEKVALPLKDTIQALIEDFKTIAEEVMNRQRENEEYLYAENQKQTERLSRVRKGQQFTKAYSGYGETGPQSRYMDKKR
jgi:hypothetical protein